jgi:oxygen-independent coproporphyrinogen-3 oxidase
VAILQALHYQEIQSLSVKEQMQEFMFLGLRCMAGVKETEFLRRFGVSLQSVYGETLTGLQKQGLMLCEKREDCTDKEQDAIWKLTPYGIDVSNSVFVEFL